MSLRLRPVTIKEVRRFIAAHHRHSPPPTTWKFGVGVETDDGELVGVASAGLPKARLAMTLHTLEINRTCTNGHKNANSMLYGALARAAKALGSWRSVGGEVGPVKKCPVCRGKCYAVTDRRDRVRSQNQDRVICPFCHGLWVRRAEGERAELTDGEPAAMTMTSGWSEVELDADGNPETGVLYR